MATYAIGDIQGCHAPLTRLLHRIDFDAAHDRLWLVGDLVNRGPDSLGVLRWARALSERGALVAVLGNHDLRLLAIHHGVRPARPSDTLADVLAAPDRAVLMAWLQALPLLHRAGGFALVHAGILPAWRLADAAACADEVQAALRGADAARLLSHLSDPCPAAWAPQLTGMQRLVFITKALTYMRVCTQRGDMHVDFSGPPSAAGDALLPWFAVPERQSRDTTIVCGHWSALGLHLADNVRALDTGCVWGRCLTAYRLEDGQIFQEPA